MASDIVLILLDLFIYVIDKIVYIFIVAMCNLW